MTREFFGTNPERTVCSPHVLPRARGGEGWHLSAKLNVVNLELCLLPGRAEAAEPGPPVPCPPPSFLRMMGPRQAAVRALVPCSFYFKALPTGWQLTAGSEVLALGQERLSGFWGRGRGRRVTFLKGEQNSTC